MLVLGSASRPTSFIGTGVSLSVCSGPSGTKIFDLPLSDLVMMIGVPSSAISSASASCGAFSG